MKIPYRTRRVIERVGFVSMMILMVLVIFWFCWVVFAQRYVVYTRDGAVLDMSFSSNDLFGEVAVPPVADEEVSIYYNEGDNSIELGNALTQLEGYYITADDLTKDLAGVWDDLERLPMGSTVNQKRLSGRFLGRTSGQGFDSPMRGPQQEVPGRHDFIHTGCLRLRLCTGHRSASYDRFLV